MGDDDQASSHAERARAATPGVTRWLTGRAPSTPERELRDLADVVSASSGGGNEELSRWDRYGEHGAVAVIESRLAELLGKPAAAMFPSGVMAQQSVLRVWCDASGSRRVALPSLSHLLRSEEDGPRMLHGFDFALLTDGPRVPLAADLSTIRGRLGAVLLELPLRDAGFILPSWEELVVFSDACRTRGVPLHLDGARLWESAPHLGHSPAEISDLADSVYVSLYKGLGGPAGAVVAGPSDHVAQARTWRTRMGGTLFSLMPYAVAALRGLDIELPRMGEYHERAVSLAEQLVAHGIRTTPSPPQSNSFRIHVERGVDDVEERRVTAMEEEHLVLTSRWAASDVPGWSWAEIVVGPSTTQWDIGEAVRTLSRVFAL